MNFLLNIQTIILLLNLPFHLLNKNLKVEKRVLQKITESPIDNFPHHVAIQFRPRYFGLAVEWQYVCGGSILSPYWVLSSGQCAMEYGPYLRIIAGKTQVPSMAGDEVTSTVRFIFVHINYSHEIRDDDNSFYRNDVALLQLRQPIQYTNHIKPIKLADRSFYKAGELIGMSTAAYGNTSASLRRQPLKLKAVSNLIDAHYEWDRCETKMPLSLCINDSGGGVVHFGPGGELYLFGVISKTTNNCDWSDVIRVGCFKDWAIDRMNRTPILP